MELQSYLQATKENTSNVIVDNNYPPNASGWDMKEGMQNPTNTNKINTNIYQSGISNGLAVNNNDNGYNADTDNTNIVDITKEDKNNNPKNNHSCYYYHVNTPDGLNSQDHNVDDEYYLNINDPGYTEDYFNLLESGVDSDKIILTTEHTIPSTIVSPPTISKDINRDRFQLVLRQQQPKRITDNAMYYTTRKEHVGPSSTGLQANT